MYIKKGGYRWRETNKEWVAILRGAYIRFRQADRLGADGHFGAVFAGVYRWPVTRGVTLVGWSGVCSMSQDLASISTQIAALEARLVTLSVIL